MQSRWFPILFSIVMAAGSFAKADEPKAEGELVFNGKDLTGWKMARAKGTEMWSAVSSVQLDAKNHARLVGTGTGTAGPEGIMLRTGEGDSGGTQGTDIYTEKTFGDCQVHVEFMVPEKSNSGVYLMGQYEIQIWSDIGTPDSKLNTHNTGSVYSTRPPSTLALKPYGEWNTFDITFRAPRFDAAGKKTENAKVISIMLNDKQVQKDVDTPKPTGGELPGGEKATGPLMLQGNHGPVAMRNIRVKPLDLK